MAIVTPALLQALFTSFKKDFQDGLGLADSSWEKVASLVHSTSASNTYAWLGKFPTMQEWVGSRAVKSMKAHGYQIDNVLYEATVGVARTDIEDDNLGIYGPAIQEMGREAGDQPNDLVYSLLAKGHQGLCYDGQNFFDTEHPIYPKVDGTGTPVNVSNISVPSENPGAAWYLLDTTRAIKPIIFQSRVEPELEFKNDPKTSDHVFNTDEYLMGVRARRAAGYGFWQMAFMSRQPLTAASYKAAREAMRSFSADGGKKLGIRPNLLVVPPSLEEDGRKLLLADEIGGSTNIWRGSAELHVEDRLG